MCICVGGSEPNNVMVRVGADAYEGALQLKGASPTIMKGRPVKGYVDLDSEGLKSLREWVKLALKFNKTLVSMSR